MARQVDHIRHTAAVDFITDPDGHGMQWHYERTDRPHAAMVTLSVFTHWYDRDKWKQRREDFWRQVEDRVIDSRLSEIVAQRAADAALFQETQDQLLKYLQPLKDSSGQIKLNKDGLPEFGLALPSMDKFVTTVLNIHDRILELREGVAVHTEQSRTPQLTDGETGALNHHLRQPTVATKISREEARFLGRALLRSRSEAQQAAVDTEGESK